MTTSTLMAALASTAELEQSGSHGASALGRLLAALPGDAASVFTIVLIVVSLAAVIWFGRQRNGEGRKFQ